MISQIYLNFISKNPVGDKNKLSQLFSHTIIVDMTSYVYYNITIQYYT